jgi:hypothetical protein
MDFFCNFLSKIFNEYPEIQSNISLLRIFQKSNARKVCEFFYQELSVYEKEINEMNEKFFIEMSISNREKFSESKYGNEICGVIELIHNHLDDENMYLPCQENTNENNKTRIWKYLKVLVFLSKKVYE